MMFATNNLATIAHEENSLAACFLGYEQDYAATLAYMHARHEAVARGAENDLLLLLEHRAVITITRQHGERSITSSPQAIKECGIDLEIADRGGDATFHGPGQLVGYPIIKLRDHTIESYI